MDVSLSVAIANLAADRLARGLDPNPAAAELQAVRDTFTVLARGDIIATEGVDPGPRAVDLSTDAGPAGARQEPLAAPGIVSAPAATDTKSVREIHASDELRVGVVDAATVRFGIPPVVWRLAQFWRRTRARPFYMAGLDILLAEVTFLGGQPAILFEDYAILGRPGGGTSRQDATREIRSRALPWLFADIRVDVAKFWAVLGPTLDGRPVSPVRSTRRGSPLPPPGGDLLDRGRDLDDPGQVLAINLADDMLTLRADVDASVVRGGLELHALDAAVLLLARWQGRDDRPRKEAIRDAVLPVVPGLSRRVFQRLWTSALRHPAIDPGWQRDDVEIEAPGRARSAAEIADRVPVGQSGLGRTRA